MAEVSEREFVRDFSEKIIHFNAALFIGSGLSRQAGYIDWKGMLRGLAEDISLEVDRENDLITLAQYYVNSRDRQKVDELIRDYFSKTYAPTEAHKFLASLPITSYWTTNYDKLLERTFEEAQCSYTVVSNDKSLKNLKNGNNIILHKLHGDVDAPWDAVITKHDYENFESEHQILLAQLKAEMCSKSFLFLGYGFNDTDIHHILSNIRLYYKGEFAQKHYSIMAKPVRGVNEKKKDFEYRKKRFKYIISDLSQYGIDVLLVDNYETDIPRILKLIRRKVYMKSVFICGSCEDEKSNMLSCMLAQRISAWLTSNGYKILCGYGKTIGPRVVAGADEGVQIERKR